MGNNIDGQIEVEGKSKGKLLSRNAAVDLSKIRLIHKGLMHKVLNSKNQLYQFLLTNFVVKAQFIKINFSKLLSKLRLKNCIYFSKKKQ